MEYPKWSDDLKIGLPEIDAQHQLLFAIFDDLNAAIKWGEGDNVLEEIFQRLEEYVKHHFHDEEAYMREIRYPKIEQHIEEHQQLLLRLKMLGKRKDKREPIDPKGVSFFLNEWITEHITSSDKLIGEFAKARR